MLLLAGSCTNERDPRPGGPCDLLKVHEIRAEVGGAVTRGRLTTPILAPPDSMCVYGLDPEFGSLEVFLDRDGADVFSKRFADYDVSTVGLEDLGDEAYLRGSSLAVRVGNAYLSLATRFDQRDAPEILKPLAAIAVTRI